MSQVWRGDFGEKWQAREVLWLRELSQMRFYCEFPPDKSSLPQMPISNGKAHIPQETRARMYRL